MKFILDHLLTVAIALVSGGGLLWLSLAPRGRLASPMQATQMINRGRSTAVIDVRSAEAYAAGHLRDAKHIPLAELATRIGELDKVKTKTIVVVDQDGKQLVRAERQLKTAGFEDIYGLEGGIAAWMAAGLPLIK